jgi:tetratricopeptide (TPR) repeat protein
MIAGLPAVLVTWYVQRTARRAYTSTPVFTTGGSASRQGTIATIAIKASPHVSWRRTWMSGAIAVGAFAVLVVAFMVMRAFGIGPAASLIGAGKLAKQEQLIITDFKSPATDSTLGLTITEALRADLAQSSALQVVPRLSMNETLRLMQRPTDTRIDFAVAREIATREGVKAVLDGDVVSLGGRYVVSARLLSAQSGEQLAALSEQASSQNDLIPALGRLSKQLRAKVGESLKSVHDATALERVTTGSMEALSKYAAALNMLEQTGDYTRVIPLLEQAVAIDSTFAMAWRRLSAHLISIGQRERASKAVTQAYRYRDRLSEVERHLAEAAYFDTGPEIDEERALEAYEAAIAIDSTNLIALNNAALILVRRRDYDRAATYAVKAASQDKQVPNPITWGNALQFSNLAGRVAASDSIARTWTQRAPNQPSQLAAQARTLIYVHRDYAGADRIYDAIKPKLASSRTLTNIMLADLSTTNAVRGKLEKAFQLAAERTARRVENGVRVAVLESGLDSAELVGLVEENPSLARQVLRRSLDRMPPDSLPLIERPYDRLLAVATFLGDSSLVRKARADYQRTLIARGKTVDRPGFESYADGLVALATGNLQEAVTKFDDAERKLIQCKECISAGKFLAYDRLGKPDSAIVAGEAYTANHVPRQWLNEAMFRPGIDQRIGELYEAKGMPEKALPHYQELVDQWKDADPELQPRVRDVRTRIARLQAQIAKKG